MSISIKGVRIETLSLAREGDTGTVKLTGEYSLISSADRVIAKQQFNGYNNVEIKPSADTIKKMDEFTRAFRNDLNSTLGCRPSQKKIGRLTDGGWREQARMAFIFAAR